MWMMDTGDGSRRQDKWYALRFGTGVQDYR
jgi:hypothetical protein